MPLWPSACTDVIGDFDEGSGTDAEGSALTIEGSETDAEGSALTIEGSDTSMRDRAPAVSRQPSAGS